MKKIVIPFVFFGLAVLLLLSELCWAAGKVYLVLGSDTAIWDGMSVSNYHCTYSLDLYTNPARNAYQVMDPSFRARMVDSDGKPLKMTWWMMAGNIFRYATNRNVPIPNIMTMYLMQKYHGHAVHQLGDELSLHYHTFGWTDYNNDGIWYWNQTRTFVECKDDFDCTLCQLLLEEKVFPVSFRSGWHFMDNDWQNYLDQLLPYSMHNDYPVHGVDVTEPLDNNYDWSQAPAEWIPFHPSPENYQRPGSCRGWNVRSAHLSTTRSRGYLHEIFKQAHAGIDQVACIWGHLPETDFLTNIQKIDSVAHHLAGIYPDVKFYYCTAIEAMQRWLKTADQEAPKLTIEERPLGNDVAFVITTDEPIFQQQPFVAAKDIYERYFIMPCQRIGQNQWQTIEPVAKNLLAKVGVAVCDTVGNQSMKFIQYLPDDIFVDNRDRGFVMASGNWGSSSNCAWGSDAQIVTVTANDTVRVQWIPDIPQSGFYNIFVQVPKIENPANRLIYRIYANDQPVDTILFNQPLTYMDWVYVATAYLEEGVHNYLELVAVGSQQPGKVVAADVAKFSALVRERDLAVDQNFINLGALSQDVPFNWNLKITNRGYQSLTILDCISKHHFVTTSATFPVEVARMSSVSLPLRFYSRNTGKVIDTLVIHSDDPHQPFLSVVVTAKVESFFIVVDNDDSSSYREFGKWATSVAQAYGPSSRYAWLNQTPLAWASFQTQVSRSGYYDIFEIVPTTVNASNHAAYVLRIQNVIVDSIIINQNQGSGSWVLLGRYHLPANYKIEVRVIDTGKNTNPNAVLRADAIKFSLATPTSSISDGGFQKPNSFCLEQNYPNPFNANTTIRYAIPKETKVQLRILNVLGQEIAKLVDESLPPGIYSVNWDANNLASGIYLYQLSTGEFSSVKKLMVVK
ncbi:MAG: T9SS type A sorting domain-containing protein [candidate division KSB1 bacterium]|nr:T9SS type A sorting domain-containing protein [candidate division KSB1 bacterium]MDZ7334624.1 T9SS type A sorting domain-containing protein [candidate division KSB1 bacterium]MDZ7357187.1 T9SS type A sorting domain-containing protein [candidate division KSB1 bacterium]